ncbi:MAG: 16S rRNA (uracil(1498)-N(3))-methyltransferase [Rothia sp. (in: high G+C Gram-positive bacteria)]|nr:16S rRNA (uracil(1498)-N(3))-methyltransferase [Rothia sp. (in: high G+C Gram-positive bacteria)]
MTAPIFYLSQQEVSQLQASDLVELTGSEGHHAKNVVRLQPGQEIDLGDGKGQRFSGQVVALLAGGLRVEVLERSQEVSLPEIYLVQALAKHDRDLLGIETATELGVRGLIPWASDRSIVRWKPERVAKQQTKWENTVRAAAKQARRALIPSVDQLYYSQQLVPMLEQQLQQGSAVLVLDENASSSLVDFAQTRLKPSCHQKIYLLVGPEGGISPQEIQALDSCGAAIVGLGKHILRSSTAGSAALASLKTVLELW